MSHLTRFRSFSISDGSSRYKSPLATISADGWVHTTSRHMLTSTCKLELQLFPFDVQKCTVSFGSMSSSGEAWLTNTLICPFFHAFFCRRRTDDIISMQPHENNSSPFRIYEQTMVTRGEWALRNIDVVLHNESRNSFSQSKVVYTVRRRPRPGGSVASAAPV